LVPTGSQYTVSVSAQPITPNQNCVVQPGTGSGTATANVTSVVVTCPAVTYEVGGTVVGLAGIPATNGPLTDNSFTLQNNLGNTLTVTQNGPFQFATPEALNDQYEITVFTLPTTQQQFCTRWNYKGVVAGNVTDPVVDCAHNDWTWIDGGKTAGTIAAPVYGTFPTSAPTTTPNPYTNTPGARYGAAGWTDKYGNLWLFGGDGWELSGNSQPDTIDAPMNDLWVCQLQFAGGFFSDQCQWQLVSGYGTFGGPIIANAQSENQPGFYTNDPSITYPTPVPGGRWGAATWTDSSGNLWLFGGNGNSHTSTGLLSDLWSFNAPIFTPTSGNYTVSTGAWTYVGGSNQVNQRGVYTGGSAVPGARVNAVTWKDASGNFWLFGGYGFDANGNEGFLNDLWKYSPSGGTWTFLSGATTNAINQLGVYGAQGTAAATNMPGARQEAVGWADASGNLWLFGGEGEDSTGTANGILNDLWVYNITSGQWTWVMGSSTANQTGVYGLAPLVGPPNTTAAAGTVGLTGATAGTLPGSRWGASSWTDNGGDFWLFGGWGLDSTATNGNGALNDFWVYVPNSTVTQPGTWTWIKGSNTGSPNGVYGPETRPYETYYIWTPGGRSNSTHWVDSLGELWLFGGEGYDATSTTGSGYLNDTWRYLPYQDY